MNAEQVYDKLRSIGCSVETSDALAPIVAELSDKKREAFFLWAMGEDVRIEGTINKIRKAMMGVI